MPYRTRLGACGVPQSQCEGYCPSANTTIVFLFVSVLERIQCEYMPDSVRVASMHVFFMSTPARKRLGSREQVFVRASALEHGFSMHGC